MSEDRVSIEVRTGDTCWTLVVSRSTAMGFVEQWRTVDSNVVLELMGVADHRDANRTAIYLDRNTITGISIQDIGRL